MPVCCTLCGSPITWTRIAIIPPEFQGPEFLGCICLACHNWRAVISQEDAQDTGAPTDSEK